MAERLVVLSDMYGAKQGLWITSYLGYLQQHYTIVFYDLQDLAHVSVKIETQENIHQEFLNGGIDTAVAHLLQKEKEPSHYLAFSMGGTVAWKAALRGLPVKSLYAISATRLRYETEVPLCAHTLLFGEKDAFKPKSNWAKQVNANTEVLPSYGHEMYTDEKIIKKVCKTLLEKATKKQSLY